MIDVVSCWTWSTTKSSRRPRREDERRDPRARPHVVVRAGRAALAGRGHVVPLPAELVVGHDDHRVLGAAAVLDRAEQVDQVIGAVALARVAGVLVLGAVGLDDAHRLELAAVLGARGRGLELGLVAQVRAAGLAGRVGGEVVERLVVELEQLARAVGIDGAGRGVGVRARPGRRPVGPPRRADVTVGVRPAARVPRPVDALGAQAVADRRRRLQRQLERVGAEENGWTAGWMVLTAKSPQPRSGGVGRGRHRLSAPSARSVLRERTAAQGVDRGVRAGSWCGIPLASTTECSSWRPRRGPGRRRRRDEPLVVEERAAEGRLEEVVGDRVVADGPGRAGTGRSAGRACRSSPWSGRRRRCRSCSGSACRR